MDIERRRSATHEPVLDGIRGLAILMVLGVHLPEGPISNGWIGVDLFFVLSGYLITTLILREWSRTGDISLRRFYLRRALRLLPALYLCLGIFALLILVTTASPRGMFDDVDPLGLLTVVFYISNWYDLGIANVFWSLSIEEQFYLVWPPILLVCLRRSIQTARLVAVLCIVVAVVCAVRIRMYFDIMPDLDRVMVACFQWTHARADAPLIGCIIALVVYWRGTPKPRIGWTIAGWASVALMLYVNVLPDIRLDLFTKVASPLTQFVFTIGFTAISLACGLLILSVKANPNGALGRVLGNSALRWFGKISYSLYLFHLFGFVVAQHLFATRTLVMPSGRGGLAILWATQVSLAIIFACISYYLVERPFVRLKRRIAQPPDSPMSA